MIKDTDEIHKVRSGRIPSVGVSVPMELGCKSSLNPIFLDYMEASSYGHDPSLTLTLGPPQRIRGRAENSKLLILAWCFQGPALIQEPPRVPALEQKTHLSPRKLQDL